MNAKRKLHLGLCVSVFLLCAASQAQADVTALFSGIYPTFFGKQAAVIPPTSSTACSTMDSYGGWMTMTNAVFCHLKNSGVNGPGTYTWGPVGNSTLHLVISKGGAGLDVTGAAATYDFQINVWVCPNTANCSVTANYTRMISLNYSYQDDGSGLNGTVNKGELILDASVFDGVVPNPDATYMVYDLGTSSANQKMIIKKVGVSSGAAFALRGDVSRSDINHISFALALNSSNNTNPVPSLRFTGSLNRSGNTGVGFAEQSGSSGAGTTTILGTGAGDPPAGSCVVVSRVAAAPDWNYTVGATTSCGSLVNAADSLATISGYTASGLVGSWDGMAATPPAF